MSTSRSSDLIDGLIETLRMELDDGVTFISKRPLETGDHGAVSPADETSDAPTSPQDNPETTTAPHPATDRGASPRVDPEEAASPLEAPAATPPSTPSRANDTGPLAAVRSLDELVAHIGDCTRCKLHGLRQHIVFGEGSPTARLMFVGEGPGAREDATGRPFVGPAGQLLDKIIAAIGLDRSEVYIANIVKCRPPNNRDPHPDEADTCTRFLMKQIELVDPEIVVTLGRPATTHLLQTDAPLSRVRGAFQDFGGRKLMPTYHPAYLLRYPQYKRAVWEDMQLVMRALRGDPTVDTTTDEESP